MQTGIQLRKPENNGGSMLQKRMSKLKLLLVPPVILLFSVSLNHTLNAATTARKDACYQGLQAYTDGWFKKAADIFKKDADKKNACSQFQLGLMYYYGHGFKKDTGKAKHWLNKSAANGFKKAEEQLEILKKKKQVS